MINIPDKVISEKRNLVFPLTFYFILSLAIIVIWWYFEKTVLDDHKSISKVISEQISYRIQDVFSHHVSSLKHLKREWEKTDHRTQSEYAIMVNDVLADFGGFQAVNFVDTAGTIIWVNPVEGNEEALGKSLLSHPDSPVVAAFKKAKKTLTFQVTPPIHLFQGGMGYASYLPVVINDKPVGFINGVFKVMHIMEYCVAAKDIGNFVFYIDDNDQEVYRSSNADDSFAMEILGSNTVFAFDRFWTVYVTLDPHFYKAYPSRLTVVFLITGIIISFVLALFLRLIFIRRDQAITAQYIYRHLVEEMDVGVVIQKNDQIVYANSKAEKISGFNESEFVQGQLSDHIHSEDVERLSFLYSEIKNNPHSTGNQEFRFIKKDSSEIWVWINCLELEWEDSLSVLHLLEDITGMKTAYLVMQNQENQARALFENIQDGVIVCDRESILFANNAFRQLVGAKTVKDIIHQPLRKFLHPEYLSKIKEGQDLILRQGGKIPFESGKLIDFSGKIIPVEVSIGTVEYLGKQTVQIFIRDLTERTAMEKDVDNNYKKYQTLFDSSINSILILKEDRFIDCNKRTLDIFNCTREEIINSTPYKFSPPFQPNGIDSKSAALAKIQEALAGKQISFEWKHTHADGTPFDADVNLKKIEFSDEVYLIATVRDITEFKHITTAEKVLLAISQAVSRAKVLDELFLKIHDQLTTLMDTSNFYIALYDDKKNLLSFPYFVDKVDPPPKPQRLGRGLSEYVIHTKKPLFVYIDGIYDLKRMGKIELLGTPSSVWMGSPLITDGKVVGVIVLQSYTDRNIYSKSDLDMLTFMSEQIAISIDKIAKEQKLRESEQRYKKTSQALLESNAMKELLLDVVSHDLKNPAGVLSGLSQMMITDNPNNEFARIIKDSSTSLLKVIDNATTLSKMVIGEKVETIEIDLIDILKGVVVDFEPQLKESGMQIEFQLDDQILIEGNPIISEIFKNYISNAIKYASHGEKIILESVVDNEHITINVKDFGGTIPEKDYLTVFKRGIQLGTGIKKGRGLGLSIVKRIGENQGGKVGVRPNEPHGNIFYLQLPKLKTD